MSRPRIRVTLLIVLICASALSIHAEENKSASVQIPVEVVRDKVRGGLLGQILGNLNGLPHEMKYIDEPGNVTDYVPALPHGAHTDDDTDFEWVYVVEMQRADSLILSPEQIAGLWKARINRRIWCANQYARQLMDLGLLPPMTGRSQLNPWSNFNISGQFLCETFGLIAPAMPQTAERIALNYTTVAIDLEPAQTTQLFTAMIATAFVEDDIDHIIDAGLTAVDRSSHLHAIIADVRTWHAQNPDDWRTTRRRLKDKYTAFGGSMRDFNGYELNTASTIAALVYGHGDFVETLTAAFNFGWDADNTAATAGTIVGVMKGYRWMMSQGWQIVDRYENTTRDEMPKDETITTFADRLLELADKVIRSNGGRRTTIDGRPTYEIVTEAPRCVMPLENPEGQLMDMRKSQMDGIECGIQSSSDSQVRARAAFLAICLDLADGFQRRRPQDWQRAIDALAQYKNVVQAIYFYADVPGGEELRRRATAAGLHEPAKREPLW